jgi:hypothetical protein
MVYFFGMFLESFWLSKLAMKKWKTNSFSGNRKAVSKLAER